MADRNTKQTIKKITNNKSQKEESQLNVWIPKELDKKLELKVVETDKNKKLLVVEALELFLL